MFENHKVARKNTIEVKLQAEYSRKFIFLAFKIPHVGFKLKAHLLVDKNAISALFYEDLKNFGFEPTGEMTHLVWLFFWTFQLFISESIAGWRAYGEYSSLAIIKNVSCGANNICWIKRSRCDCLRYESLRKSGTFDKGTWPGSSRFATLRNDFSKFRRRKLLIATDFEPWGLVFQDIIAKIAKGNFKFRYRSSQIICNSAKIGHCLEFCACSLVN